MGSTYIYTCMLLTEGVHPTYTNSILVFQSKARIVVADYITIVTSVGKENRMHEEVHLPCSLERLMCI